MRGSKRLWIIALMMILALVAAACGDDDGEGDDAGGDTGETEEAYEAPAGTPMAEWQEEGSVTIGVKFDVPPFGFENPQSGEVEGFDVDMGNYIADKLGVEAEFIEAISDNRIPFLEDGTADLILSTMTITTDRDTEIDFSRPYYIAQGRILVPETRTSRASTIWGRALPFARHLARRTRGHWPSRPPTPSLISWTRTRSASRRSRTVQSTRSRPTTSSLRGWSFRTTVCKSSVTR